MINNAAMAHDVLKHLKAHTDQIVSLKAKYDNVIQFFFTDLPATADHSTYFLSNKLVAERLDPLLVTRHTELFQYFWYKVHQSTPPYKEIWMTTAYLTDQHLFLLELSFE